MEFKEQYWKYSLIAIILLLGVILFFKLTPFMGGFLGACTIYIMLRKQMRFLTHRWHMGKSLSAILLLLEAILCFVIPITLMVWLMVNQIQTVSIDPDAIVDTVKQFSEWLHAQVGYTLFSTKNLETLASALPAVGQFVMGGISSFVVNIFVLIFVLFFMLKGSERMERYIYEILPFNPSNKQKMLNEIHVIVRSNAIGIPLLALIQGAVALLGYYLFDVPNLWLFAFLTCFATVIPVVGTAIVWLPLVGYACMQSEWTNAIGLLLYCGLIVTNIDNLIRFILQKQMADTHPLITVFGVIVGLPLFGFMGVIFGPLLLSVFILCVDIFKNQYLE